MTANLKPSSVPSPAFILSGKGASRQSIRSNQSERNMGQASLGPVDKEDLRGRPSDLPECSGPMRIISIVEEQEDIQCVPFFDS